MLYHLVSLVIGREEEINVQGPGIACNYSNRHAQGSGGGGDSNRLSSRGLQISVTLLGYGLGIVEGVFE